MRNRKMQQDLISQHENASVELLNHHFTDLEALKRHLDQSGIQYLLEPDLIGMKLPKNANLSQDKRSVIHDLVLLPRTARKLYRFRVSQTHSGSLLVEADFAYKNPYQSQATYTGC